MRRTEPRPHWRHRTSLLPSRDPGTAGWVAGVTPSQPGHRSARPDPCRCRVSSRHVAVSCRPRPPPTATVAARQFDRCFSHPGPRITVPASGCRGAPTLHNQIRSARGINDSQGPGRGSWPVGGQVAVHPPVPALLAGARSGNGSRPRRSGPSPTGSTTRNLEDGPDHLHPHGRLGHGCSSEVPRRDP